MEKSDVIITVAVVLAPAVITFAWVMWENSVLPAMVPKPEIVAQANELIDEHGDRAQEVAANREYEAWYRSELTHQGRWKRVRREIRRRQQRD